MATTFVLVHGAWHGSWCWERVIEPLGKRGHEAVAVDLPCEDPDAGLDAYADAIAAAVPAEAEDVVLVGHSLGGLPLSLVATGRPVSAIVYLSAFIPVPGQSMADQFGASPEPILLMEGGREGDELGRSFWKEPAATARVLYPDLDAADAEWAFSRLRPQAQLSQTEQHPTGLPEVPSASIVGSQDRTLNPEWSRRVTRERLGVEPIELAAGHFSMISHPGLLAETLSETAATVSAQQPERQ